MGWSSRHSRVLSLAGLHGGAPSRSEFLTFLQALVPDLVRLLDGRTDDAPVGTSVRKLDLSKVPDAVSPYAAAVGDKPISAEEEVDKLLLLDEKPSLEVARASARRLGQQKLSRTEILDRERRGVEFG